MKHNLLTLAVVATQSVMAADTEPAGNKQSTIVEKAIRKSLKKPAGELTRADLVKVTELNLNVSSANRFQSGAMIKETGLDEVGRRIVEYVKSSEATGFSGSVLAARNGKVVATVGVGSCDLAGKSRITPDTLFEIASATKQFTAAAVMRLVQENRLGLDDSIAKHLPDVPVDCKAITVRHLLQHTSGIPRKNSQGSGEDLGKVLPLFLLGGPRHPPGTRWEYWNQGYALLSEIIARASGQQYTDFCQRALFTPSGMHMTRFTGDAAPKGATIAVGRSAHGKPRSALEHPYGNYGFQYRGMGGVVTTVWDLWRWDRTLHGEAVLGQSAKSELFKPGLRGYALGWFVKKNKGGRQVQFHGGSVRGFACQIRRYPKQDACLFVLSNRDDIPVGKMASTLERILFGDPPTSRKLPRAQRSLLEPK